MYINEKKVYDNTTRQLRKRTKEHVPKSVDNFCCLDNKDDIPAKVLKFIYHRTFS